MVSVITIIYDPYLGKIIVVVNGYCDSLVTHLKKEHRYGVDEALLKRFNDSEICPILLPVLAKDL